MDNISPGKNTSTTVKAVNPPNVAENKTPAAALLREHSFEEVEHLEQDKLLAERKKKAQIAFFLKNTAILLFVTTLFSFIWFTFDLHPQNKYLSSVDIENVGVQFSEKSERSFLLDTKLLTIDSKINGLRYKMENEKFLEYQKEIDDIRSEQLIWFDRRDGETYLFGMMDVFERVADFFNDRRYSDPQKIVSGRRDQIKIDNISVDRTGARLSIEASQILGRVFFLTNEFIDIVNSIPFYMDADIKSFNREKNDFGDDSMKFSINLKRQENPNKESQIPHPEIDSNDIRFEEFLEWFNNVNK